MRDSPADSLLTVRYVELLRAELLAQDPMPTFRITQCEQSRVRRVVTKGHGHIYAIGVLRAAERRAYRGVPKAILRAHSDRLPLTIPAVSDEVCIALARAGVLGDTIFPPAGE